MVPVTYVRARKGKELSDRDPFGPKTADHPTVGMICIPCGDYLKEGDYTTLVPLGPGNDPEEQERAQERRWYNATALEVHALCAGVEIPVE